MPNHNSHRTRKRTRKQDRVPRHWLKLHRKFVDWEWYDDPIVKSVFLHLLLDANWAKRRWRGIDIEPGQVVTGRRALADVLGISEKRIRNALKKLEKTGEICQKRASKRANSGTLITIRKWDQYQGNVGTTGQTTGQRRANEGPTKGQRRASKEEEQKNRIEEDPPLPPKGQGDVFEEKLSEWIDYRNPRPKTIEKIRERWSAKPVDFASAVDHSIAQGYRGLIAPSATTEKKASEENRPRPKYVTFSPTPDEPQLSKDQVRKIIEAKFPGRGKRERA